VHTLQTNTSAGCSPTSASLHIEHAHRHPDKNANSDESTQKFQQINAACECACVCGRSTAECSLAAVLRMHVRRGPSLQHTNALWRAALTRSCTDARLTSADASDDELDDIDPDVSVSVGWLID
jgi:hypothetical protein